MSDDDFKDVRNAVIGFGVAIVGGLALFGLFVWFV